MNIVNKLIYNRLVAGQGIGLPDVGALMVTQNEAQVHSGKVIAPQRRVEFIATGYERSIVDTLAEEGNVSQSDAQTIYQQWQSEFNTDGEIDFEDSGRVSGGVFRPTDKLNSAMNPFGEKNKKNSSMSEKKRCGCCWLWWLLGIVVAVAVAIAVLCYFGKWEGVKNWTVGLFGADKTEQVVESTDDGVEALVLDSVDEAGTNSAAQPTDENLSASTTNEAPVVSAQPKYYLIAGVFSNPANADKLIKQNKYYSNSYEKIEYKGKTAVSVFSSISRVAVAQRKFELEDIDRELWLLKQ